MMTAHPDTTERMTIGPLPEGWGGRPTSGLFEASRTWRRRTLQARVRVFEPIEENTQYLLDHLGTRVEGPLGRPQVRPLPDDLAEGVSVLAFDETDEGALTARIDLVRRFWNRDIIVSAHSVPVEAVDEFYDAMIDLLATVHPTEVER